MLKIKNSLGQIFLKNKKIIKKIVNFIKPKKKDILIEIGYGNGEISNKIIKYNKNLTSLEIDKFLIKKNKKKNTKIKIININVLKFNFLNFFKKKKKKIRIFGNIPYYISKKLFFIFIKNFKIIKDIHIMIQKEFFNLLISKKGDKKYNKISILVKYFYNIKILINIKKKFFYPKPKVNSVFIMLKPRKKKYKLINIKHFIHILNISFKRKKKKTINNLKNILNKKIIKKNNINLNERPNKISIKNFCKITNLYSKYKFK